MVCLYDFNLFAITGYAYTFPALRAGFSTGFRIRPAALWEDYSTAVLPRGDHIAYFLLLIIAIATVLTMPPQSSQKEGSSSRTQ